MHSPQKQGNQLILFHLKSQLEWWYYTCSVNQAFKIKSIKCKILSGLRQKKYAGLIDLQNKIKPVMLNGECPNSEWMPNKIDSMLSDQIANDPYDSLAVYVRKITSRG